MKKILLITITTIFAFTITGVTMAADPSNLVGWWRFEGNADDSSGKGNNGTEVGTTTYTTGKIGQAISLNGNPGNYIEVPDDDSLDLDTVTIEAWIKIDSGEVGTGQRNIVRKGHFGNRTYGLDTVVVSGTKRVLRGWVNVGLSGGAAAKIVTGATNLADDKWHHVAMTYDKNYVKIFVDGNLEGTPVSATDGIYDNNLSVRIGGQKPTDSGGALAFKGLIDEVRIWNVALDPEDFFMDKDEDGVYGEFDKCPGTKDDNWQIDGKMIGTAGYLGVNRHMWNGEKFVTLLSKNAKGKTNFYQADSEFTMDYTYGCSCEQIIERMQEKTGFNFEGHVKFGCSKSLIEDWHEGKYYIGDDWVLQETVQVPANSNTPVTATTEFENGTQYKLVAYGTAWACNQYGCHIEFDAEYSINYDGYKGWIDGVEQYEYWGPNLLDLKVNGEFIDWDDDDTYNEDHTYYYYLTGTGSPATFEFVIYDIYYPNNTGYLSVDIYKLEPQYVDLW